jgi:hypothetical protein
MEGKDVKSLAAMFESKTRKNTEAPKKQEEMPKATGETNVKNLAAVFERKATNKFD